MSLGTPSNPENDSLSAAKGEPYLPPLPSSTTPQSCATFTPAPLDGSFSLSGIVEWNMLKNGGHPFFLYASASSGDLYSIHWSEAARAMSRAANIVQRRVGAPVSTDKTVVVATLASIDLISYLTTFFGIIRANCVPFQMSPRNSPAAVAHLLVITGAKHVLVGRDRAIKDVAKQAVAIISEQHPEVTAPELSEIPFFDELFRGDEPDSDIPLRRKQPDSLAFLLHSSGSTAFPKVIPWTERHALEVGLAPFFGSRNLSGKKMSIHGLPSFHGFIIGKTLFSMTSGYILSPFEPCWPPISPTPENCFEGIKATGSDLTMCVPSMIEAWATNEDYIKWFATMDGIIFSGGPLSKETGDKVSAKGVKIFNLLGGTDIGLVSEYLPVDIDMDWEYISFTEWAGVKMIPYGDNTFEYVMLESPFCTLGVVNTTINDRPAFATSDLFMPHPTKPGYWKLFGRKDDQIMHSNGEKTNPGPLEHILSKDPHVAFSVMFGRGRFNAGVIVQPTPEWNVDPKDETAVAEFRNKIWPTVEEMNRYAPQHSRIFKEMILLASPTKPFPLTAKSTPRRALIVSDYEEEINGLYDTVERSTQAAPDVVVTGWGETETRLFVRAVVTRVMVRRGNPSDDDDLFQFGCDSLQATWIRNTLLRVLRDSAEIETRIEMDNFVYRYPTIRSLAGYISRLAAGSGTESGYATEEKVRQMLEMAEKYTSDLPTSRSLKLENTTGKEIILLTGPTGALGSHILSRLLASNTIDKVVALGRKALSGISLHARLISDFHERDLDTSLLNDKLVLLEGDLSKEKFALTEEEFELTKGTTSVIHNAWRVDFNLGLRSFESNVKGLRGLLDLSLTSGPKKFFFLSSVGVLHLAPPDVDLNEDFVPPEWASANGYAQSKWVAEKILEKMSTQFPSFKSTVIRIGQLSGGSNGAWNKHEWVPAIVQSAAKIGVLPIDKNDKSVSWLPIHIAADAIVNIVTYRGSPEDIRVIHLADPTPIRWRTLAEAFIHELRDVQLAPYDVWFSKLEAEVRGSSPEELTALRLLSVFRGMGDSQSMNREAFGAPALRVEKIKAFGGLTENGGSTIGEEDVKQWMGYWRRVGLFE